VEIAAILEILENMNEFANETVMETLNGKSIVVYYVESADQASLVHNLEEEELHNLEEELHKFEEIVHKVMAEHKE